MASTVAWARKLRPMRCSALRWPITGSMAKRRLRSRLIWGLIALKFRVARTGTPRRPCQTIFNPRSNNGAVDHSMPWFPMPK